MCDIMIYSSKQSNRSMRYQTTSEANPDVSDTRAVYVDDECMANKSLDIQGSLASALRSQKSLNETKKDAAKKACTFKRQLMRTSSLNQCALPVNEISFTPVCQTRQYKPTKEYGFSKDARSQCIDEENVHNGKSLKNNTTQSKRKMFHQKRSLTADNIQTSVLAKCTPEKERSRSLTSPRDSITSETLLLESKFAKPASNKKKTLQRSVSLCLNKIKQISSRNQQNRYEYAELDEEETHCLRNEGQEGALNGAKSSRLIKSASLPEDIDRTSLYLPRRMAICSQIKTPAREQLKTYIVIQRLQQYNFL